MASHRPANIPDNDRNRRASLNAGGQPMVEAVR